MFSVSDVDLHDHEFNIFQLVQAEIEIGDGLPDIRSTEQCIDALKKASFEVSEQSLSLSLFHN